MQKNKNAYKTISEAAKEIGLINKKNNTANTHTLRFWEKNFKQIKPKILSGKRRYYSNKQIQTISLIKFLLKEKGMTINGAKALLNNQKSITLDDTMNYDVSSQTFDREKIKSKINKITKIINELKEIKNG